jgi:hypothetical protein
LRQSGNQGLLLGWSSYASVYLGDTVHSNYSGYWVA